MLLVNTFKSSENLFKFLVFKRQQSIQIFAEKCVIRSS